MKAKQNTQSKASCTVELSFKIKLWTKVHSTDITQVALEYSSQTKRPKAHQSKPYLKRTISTNHITTHIPCKDNLKHPTKGNQNLDLAIILIDNSNTTLHGYQGLQVHGNTLVSTITRITKHIQHQIESTQHMLYRSSKFREK